MQNWRQVGLNYPGACSCQPVRFNTAPCRFTAHWIPTSHILSLPNNCRRQKTCFLPIFYIQEICTACSLHIIMHVKILHSLFPAACRSMTRQRKCRAIGSGPIPRGPEGAAECRVPAHPIGNAAHCPAPWEGSSSAGCRAICHSPGAAGEGAVSRAPEEQV